MKKVASIARDRWKLFPVHRIIESRLPYLVAFIAIIIAIFSSISPYFAVPSNFLYMFKYAGILGLLGFAETFVILAGGGGIDLSVGSMLSLAGVLLYFMSTKMNVWLASALTLPIGMTLGAVNGLLCAVAGIPPFIGTLATMFAYAGISLGITKGVALSGFPKEFAILGEGLLGNIPIQFLFLIAVFIPLGFMLRQTAFGRHIIAVGDNEQAAQLLGISPKRIRFSLYVLSGALAALGAILMDSWLLTARPDAGAGYELKAIAVAVLGGTDISGGSGTLSGTLLATIIVVMLQMGLQQLNINPVWQLGIIGVLLVGVALLNQIIMVRRTRQISKGG